MCGTRNWREIRGERALNERRVADFRRLMDAQQRVAEALAPRGVTDAELDAALSAAEAALPRDEHDERDFCLPALALFVGSLGGALESDSDGLRAVFVDVTVGVDPSDP